VVKTRHDFYTELVRKKGWAHIAPLLDLLPTIEAETQSRGLNIFTSHEVLRITPHTEYSEWTHDDILSIVPDRSGVARVVFQTKEDLNLKIPIVDVFEKGGSLIPYHELIAAIIPYLEKLAQKKRA
jgi:hypothetical protein